MIMNMNMSMENEMSVVTGNSEYKDLIVDKQSEDVAYNDEKHVYIGKTGNAKGKKFTSVTTLIGKYEHHFDSHYMSRRKALEELIGQKKFDSLYRKIINNTNVVEDDYYLREGITKQEFDDKVQEYLDKWKETNQKACERGTAIHSEMENSFYTKKNYDLSNYGLAGRFETRKNSYDLNAFQDGIFPEFLISFVSSDGKLRIAGQVDLLIKEGNNITIGDFKGLALDTPIFTTKGFKTMGDITKSDILFDINGKKTNILNISSIHHNPCYKIKFDNGDEIIADHEHKWIISFLKGTNKFIDKEMTTLDVYNWMRTHKRISNVIPKIKTCKPLELNDVDLPIDPYILGSWLGDGSKSCGMITNINRDFWNEVKKRGYEFGEDVSAEDRAESRTIFGLRTKLKELGVLHNKHIPDVYLTASYNQRLDLLRGLMDTDGHYNKTRNRFVMSTSQEWQASGLEILLSTLGQKTTRFKVKKPLNEKIFDAIDVCFSTNDFNPFLVRNQDCINAISKNKNSFRNILSIEKIDTVETRCIEVDSSTHTYLCGRNLIPTHNTNRELKFESYAYFDKTKKKKVHKMMKFPLTNIMDCNFMHYTLQLSLYAFLVQRLNPNYNISLLKIIHFDHDGNVEEYELEYRKKEVERLLKHYKLTLEKEEYESELKGEINQEETQLDDAKTKYLESKEQEKQNKIKEKQEYIESRKAL